MRARDEAEAWHDRVRAGQGRYRVGHGRIIAGQGNAGMDTVRVRQGRAESRQRQSRGRGMAGKTRAGQAEPGQGMEGHNRGRTGAAIQQGQDRGRFWTGYGKMRSGQGMAGVQQVMAGPGCGQGSSYVARSWLSSCHSNSGSTCSYSGLSRPAP